MFINRCPVPKDLFEISILFLLGKNELDIINYYFTSHLLILCPNRNVGDCSLIDSVKEGYCEYFLPYVSADLVKMENMEVDSLQK